MSRLEKCKSVLWFICGLALVISFFRFWRGLGATTALTDRTPWGLWVGFGTMSGVALAGGGFVVAAVVHIFHLERYRPILRPAVLMALLGYGTVIVGLLFELGLPHNIWRPVRHWQHHSALFEVAWCVMLYFTVLILEFAPVIVHRLRFLRLYHWLHKLTIPLVIVGIMLSTLHQSSLGTILTIMPYRVHPLWYSPILPILFFVSSIGLGLMMVTAGTLTTAWLYRRPARAGEPGALQTEILAGLARATAPVLTFYLVLRLGDLWYRGQLTRLGPDWPTLLFFVEIVLTTLLPIGLLLSARVRQSHRGLAWASGLVVFGFMLNRIVTSGLSMVPVTLDPYIPSWMEVTITAGIVSAAILVFFFFVENLEVWPEALAKAETSHWKQSSWRLGMQRYSLIFVSAMALAYALLSDEARGGAKPVPTPVKHARGGADLLVDGNRNGFIVKFSHVSHQQNMDGEKSCVKCHHMNKPLDSLVSCAECHRDYYLSTQLFEHQRHIKELGGSKGCRRCHEGAQRTTATCESCHPDLRPTGSLINQSDPQKRGWAPGYKDAMHGLCLTCHESQAQELGVDELAKCSACHKEMPTQSRRSLELMHGHPVSGSSTVQPR